MSMFDDMRTKEKDIMSNPATRETIQRIANEHGMTLEEAKIHFLRQQND